MGVLGVKFPGHEFLLQSNSTFAELDGQAIALTEDFTMTIDSTTITCVGKKYYEITIENDAMSITFIRKVYLVSGLDGNGLYLLSLIV